MTQLSKNKGFTIIELMIAVAIVGVLAAIAVPAYSNYIDRAKVSEALTFASSAKTAVAEYHQTNGAFPSSNEAAGLATSISASNIASLTVTGSGVITVVTSGIDPNATLILTPTSNNGGLTWKCTSEGNTRVVPANCRNQ